MASLAKFYDYVVEKGGKEVPEDRVATILSEAALVDYRTTCALLREAKQLAEKTLDPVIGLHRERIMLAEYYAQNPPPPEMAYEADGYKRYADHYRIGLDRGRDVCFAPRRSAASYPTAVEMELLHASRLHQYMTLGASEFAQPDQLAVHIPQLAAPRPHTPPAAHQQMPPAPPVHQQAPPAPAAHQQIPAAYRPLGSHPSYGAPHPAPAPAQRVPGVHPPGVAYASYGAPRAAAAPAAWHPATAALHPAASHGHGTYPPAGGRALYPGVPQPHAPHPGVPSLGGAHGGVYRAPAPNRHHGTRPGQ